MCLLVDSELTAKIKKLGCKEAWKVFRVYTSQEPSGMPLPLSEFFTKQTYAEFSMSPY